MKTGTIIAIVGGVFGLGAAGYVLYRRSQANATLIQAQQQGTQAQAQQPVQTVSPLEGKAFRTVGNGKIYVVRNGILRHMWTPDVMQRELGTKDWGLLKNSGVGADVQTLPDLPVGPVLNGLNTTNLLY